MFFSPLCLNPHSSGVLKKIILDNISTNDSKNAYPQCTFSVFCPFPSLDLEDLNARMRNFMQEMEQQVGFMWVGRWLATLLFAYVYPTANNLTMGIGRGIYFWFSLHMFIEVCDWWRMVLQFRTEKSWIERLMFIETGCTGGTDHFGVGHHSSGLYSYIWIHIFAHDWHAWIYKELPTSFVKQKTYKWCHVTYDSYDWIKHHDNEMLWCGHKVRQSILEPANRFQVRPGEWLATLVTSLYIHDDLWYWCCIICIVTVWDSIHRSFMVGSSAGLSVHWTSWDIQVNCM